MIEVTGLLLDVLIDLCWSLSFCVYSLDSATVSAPWSPATCSWYFAIGLRHPCICSLALITHATHVSHFVSVAKLLAEREYDVAEREVGYRRSE